MLFFRPIRRVATRTALLVLVVLIAMGGLPAWAAMTCNTSGARCQAQAAHHDHCPKGTVVVSCACHGADQPANPVSTRTSDVVAPAATHGSTASVYHAPPVLAFSRPDYSIARGRLLVPLPILHGSLLI